jgi:hypothetical protein
VRRTLMVLVVAVGLCVPAAGAQAASIVFTQDDGNIYLANADGSGIFQVTLDGDSSDPYGPPSQADDGTIVTARGDDDNTEIIRMTQNGTVLGSFLAPFLFHGDIIDSDVSPDGSRIAYTSGYFGDGSCNPVAPPAVGTTACVATRVASSGGADLGGPPPGTQTPSWMSNTRLLTGDMSNLRFYDGGSSDTYWFGPDSGATGINDDNPDDADFKADRLVTVNGGAGNHKFIWIFGTPGASTGSPSPPSGTACFMSGPVQGRPDDVFRDPTLSSDGTSLAWEETDNDDTSDASGEGIWIRNLGGGSLATACASPLPTGPAIPFAHYPDFGPADVNPAPRSSGGGGGGGGTSGGGGSTGGGGGGGGGAASGSGSGSGSGTGTGTGTGTGGPPAGASGAATKAIATASAGSLGLTLMAPGTCVPAGQPVDLAVTSATKKAITKKKGKLATAARRHTRKVTYKIKQVTFSLDTSKSVDKRAAFTAAFSSTGMASGSGHRVGAKVALKKSGSRKTTNKSLSGSISIC